MGCRCSRSGSLGSVEPMTHDKIKKAREFVAKVEADLGHELDSHIIDLFMDNAVKLGFTDDECLTAGNLIRVEKGLPVVGKWW